MDFGELPEGLVKMIRAIEDKPDFPERLARMAHFVKQTKKYGYLSQYLALHAWSLAPDDRGCVT